MGMRDRKAKTVSQPPLRCFFIDPVTCRAAVSETDARMTASTTTLTHTAHDVSDGLVVGVACWSESETDALVPRLALLGTCKIQLQQRVPYRVDDWFGEVPTDDERCAGKGIGNMQRPQTLVLVLVSD